MTPSKTAVSSQEGLEKLPWGPGATVGHRRSMCPPGTGLFISLDNEPPGGTATFGHWWGAEIRQWVSEYSAVRVLGQLWSLPGTFSWLSHKYKTIIQGEYLIRHKLGHQQCSKRIGKRGIRK